MISTRGARAYATNDRVDKSGAHLGWYWSEDRASSLDLATFNGIDVGEYDREREPGKWREVLAVLDGVRERVNEVGPVSLLFFTPYLYPPSPSPSLLDALSPKYHHQINGFTTSDHPSSFNLIC